MEQAYLKIENRPRFSFRWGKHNDGGYKAIDALTYSYNGNQVQHISDQAGSLVYDGSFDFKTSDASGQYRFNGNGSMTYDPDKGITIDYSDTGTPQKISFDSGSSTEYVYSADGTKLKVSWNSGQTMCKSFGGFIFFDDFFPPETGSGSGNGSSQSGSSSTTVKSSTEYAGPFVITDGELKQFLFDGGYCTLDNRQAKFHYYVKDHLGSNRIVMSEDGTIEQKTHYYPFGGVYGDVSTNTDVQDYKYNGKELDHMHGLDLYDYGARMYDAAAGRWTSVDPLAEKYYHISPYAYCANNPVKFVDLHGDSIKIFDIASIEAIYNAVQPGTKLSMKFNNGVLIPESIQDIASESQDVFLQDLYSISIDPQMVEIATTNTNDYFIGDCFYHDNWDAPEDFDYAKEYNNGQESSLFPSGKTLVGNLGQTLFPIYLSEHKRSTNNNIRININSLGNLNQRSCGIAHEFGHVILYLRGLPYTHSGNADFIYERQWNVMKRFGYDYLESTTGKIFRKL